MNKIISFKISKSGEYYTAECLDFAIVTQAKTLDELAKNIREATDLHLEGENLASLGLSPDPALLINYELPTFAHA